MQLLQYEFASRSRGLQSLVFPYANFPILLKRYTVPRPYVFVWFDLFVPIFCHDYLGRALGVDFGLRDKP